MSHEKSAWVPDTLVHSGRTWLVHYRPAIDTAITLCDFAINLNVRYTCSMHIISRKALRLFWEEVPDSASALQRWYRIVNETEYKSFVELRQTFPSADKVGDLIVFNIGGNKIRLITSIHFNRGKVYVRHVLTHEEYDRGTWKT